jgi:AraC family transcriptional regulator
MQPLQLQAGSYCGRVLRSCRLSRLYLAELRYGPQFTSSLHSHEHAYCYLTLEGACTQTVRRRPRTVATSSLVFLPAGEPHSDFWPGTGGRSFILDFDPGWIEHVRECSQVMDQPLEFRGGRPVWLAVHLYQELLTPDDVSGLAIEGLALELAAQLARDSTPEGRRRRRHTPAWLERVVDLVESRFREQLTLEEMAREGGVHRVHLVNAFRQHLNCTPFDFLRRRRVDFAARKLIKSQASRLDIALEAGFADQSHFCKVFKSVTGMTPTEYQRLFSRRL